MKHFTLAEAEALIPELERIFEALLEIAAKAEHKAEAIRSLELRGRDQAQLAIERSQLQFLASGMNEWFQKVLELGAVPKGLDPALVDFPHRLGGREVYLCWRFGEKKITHYHGLEDGFSGRRRLPSRRPS